MKLAFGAGSALVLIVALAGAVAAQSPGASPGAFAAGSPAAPSIGDITNVPHPAHIHSGSCANLGGIVVPLQDVTLVQGSDRVGASTTETDMKIADMLSSPHAIMTHASAQNMGTYIACADLQGDASAKVLTVALSPQNNSGFVGVAFIQEANGKTEVDLSLTAPETGAQPAGSPEPAASGSAATMPPMSMAPASSEPTSGASPSSGASAAAGQSVTIQNFAFSPATLTVAVGTTVTWTNADTTQHTVTADDGSFDSGVLAPGATFSQTFTTAGTFAYHCNIHSTMHGTITVK